MTIEPYAGFYQTAWYLDSENTVPPDRKHFYHNRQYELGGEISSEISRVYAEKQGKKLRHVIIPRLSYAYTPGIDENEYPQSDDQVPVTGDNVVSLSITQIFISKTPLEKPGTDGRYSRYRQICRFFVEQPYDLSRRDDPDHALLPLYAEFDLTPSDRVSVRADGKYDHIKNRLDSGNISFLMEDVENRLLQLDYRYTKELNQSVYTQLRIPVSVAWTVYGDYERNISDNLDVRTSVGVRYTAQCWAVNFSYAHEENDQKIAATIELSGLGGSYEP